jgi:hypothetical protein
MATTKAKPVKEVKVAPVVVPAPVVKAAPKEPKMLPSERRAMKRREAADKATLVFGTGKGSAEPTIRALSYQIDLMRALNYYNSAYDSKDKRKWTMAYVGKANANDYDALSDYHFGSVGTIIRMKMRDVYLEEKELNFIETKLAELRELSAAGGLATSSLKGGPKVKVDKPVVSIQDRVVESASKHIGEIDGMIDEFILNDTELDVASYLKSNDVSPAVSKLIPAAFARVILELKEAIKGEDKQLVEGYSHLKKMKLRKLLKSYESIADACSQQVVSAKAVKKPTVRVIKEKPASVIANKVKFMRESTELGLKSVMPATIVGASEAWIYNTKYKKIQVYRALGDGKLSLKGTTIINYEVASSDSKTVRKPETVKLFVAMARKTIAAEYKALTTKVAAVNGRINEDSIILKVFA